LGFNLQRTETMKTPISILAVLIAVGLQPLALLGQGSLTPSGPPAPGMLTLAQVQPRTPVDSVHTPGNSANEFVISNPGSYYLTTNIMGVSSEEGIDIVASDVTLDLNGFSLIGPSTAYSGIAIYSTVTNVVVRNGIISGWGTLYNGISCLGNNVDFENLTIYGELTGISCFGDGGVIKNCTLSRTGQYGIYLTGSNYLVTCNNFIEINTGNNGNGAAMYIASVGNHIDGNNVIGNNPAGYGLWVLGTNNVVVRNSISGNAPNNYAISSVPNDVGPIGNASTNTSPWGNISN